MIMDEMLNTGLFSLFIGIISSLIYITYLLIRKKNLKGNYNPITFGVIFGVIYIFVKFFLIDFINKNNEDISKYIASNKIEKKHWKEQEIIQLKNFYNSYYDVKLMNTLFKDYKYNMISTLKIYKNEIIKSAVDCVSFNIQNEFNSEEEYSKSNFIRTDNELINECISDKKIHTIYMNITNSWNEFTRAEIEDNVLNGILTALKENQTFTNEKIELTNKFIGVEVATCTFNKIKEKYPNYSEFNYGFYEINLPEVKNDFDNIKESCLNKSLNKWNKQN